MKEKSITKLEMVEYLENKWYKKIFTIIKKWLCVFGRKSEEKVDINIKVNTKEVNKNDFKENIQVKSQDRILYLQCKLKERKIEISELTDEELDEMIDLFKKQIIKKQNILKQYRKNNK